MPNFVSPGSYVTVKDISEYVPTINSSVVGVVGFASKGPVDTATLITSQQNLIEKFGEPSEGIAGQGLEGALEILEATNNLYYVRAADATTGANASSVIPMGSCPAIQVSAGSFGVTNDLYLKVQVYDNNGVAQYSSARNFNIPSGTVASTSTQAVALRSVVGGSLDSDEVGIFYDSASDTSGYIVGRYSGSGAYISVQAASGSDFDTQGAAVLKVVGITGEAMGSFASSIDSYGITLSSTITDGSAFQYTVQSLYYGAGYNGGTTTAGATSGNSIEIDNLGGSNFILTVNEKGAAKESFKVTLDNSGVFIEDAINTGTTNVTSEVIQGELFENGIDFTANSADWVSKLTSYGLSNGIPGSTIIDGGDEYSALATPRFIKPLAGTYNLSGGNNGIAADYSDDLIGISTAATKTGMQALDDDSLNISIAVIPGISTQSVQNALISLAETSENFLAVVSPPYAVGSVQNAIDWTNGRSETRTAAINSSKAVVVWPWVKTYSVYDKIDRWYDPAIYMVRQMCYTDNVAYPWFAPAGVTRGRLTKPIETEVKLNQGDRDSLYSGGNIINPIVNFPNQGIMIFGQRTGTRTASSRDRINVERMLIYLRKIILGATRIYVFEPNDPITWSRVENALNPVIDEIKRNRGITDFRVVCDSTVNTPVRIDRNEMWTKVLIKPTKTAEILVFELNLVSQTAQLGTV